MAQVNPHLPLDCDGVCMLCKEKPSEEAILCCGSCASSWHVACLSEIKNSAAGFQCPDCSGEGLGGAPAPEEKNELFDKIRKIQADTDLSEAEKARKRMELLGGKFGGNEGEASGVKKDISFDIMGVIGQSLKCSYCMELPERPVTTPCGHNFCLNCFEKWIKQGKRTCAKCRSNIPDKIARHPHINSTLVTAIRMAKLSQTITSGVPQTVYRFVHDQDRPDAAYVTDRAQKPGMANAASGRIFVTLPRDHFGPITAEDDPERNLGVLVGETWGKRIEARQWGVHYPPVGGISGKAHYGSQSVVISGGYEDDEDHGEWFIYTGSGGRDLDGNKRTNKVQSSDQEFKEYNQALRVSCAKGYPVRVMRSEKDKRSPYAPEEGYRYDGIYRVEKCWRKAGIQKFLVCRYLFVRCDNEPAPWTSNDHGDRPRKMPVINELEEALDVFEREDSPSWDYDEVDCRWKWKKPPPRSEEKVVHVKPEERAKTRKVIRKAQTSIIRERLLKGFCCLICKNVMNLPMTTPCAHNFCKPCLENEFSGQSFAQERVCQNGRRLRSKKNVLNCPACPTDISEFLKSPQVNTEIMEVIEKLQSGLDMFGDDAKDDEAEEASDGGGSDKGKEVAVEQSPKEGHHENPLKRKHNLSDEENTELPKKRKEEIGGDDVTSSVEKDY